MPATGDEANVRWTLIRSKSARLGMMRRKQSRQQLLEAIDTAAMTTFRRMAAATIA